MFKFVKEIQQSVKRLDEATMEMQRKTTEMQRKTTELSNACRVAVEALKDKGVIGKTNLVKINYHGKDYIGEIRKIDLIYSYGTYMVYSVSMFDKGTKAIVSDIEISNFSEIKLLDESK